MTFGKDKDTIKERISGSLETLQVYVSSTYFRVKLKSEKFNILSYS